MNLRHLAEKGGRNTPAGNDRAPYVPVPDGLPGLVGAAAFKPATGGRLQALAQQLLRGPSPLSAGEREMIAAFVSSRNGCYFCSHLHAAVAVRLHDGDHESIRSVIDDIGTARVSETMRALFRIAAAVRRFRGQRSAQPTLREPAPPAPAPETRTSTTPFSWRPRSACSTGSWMVSRRSSQHDEAVYDLPGQAPGRRRLRARS